MSKIKTVIIPVAGKGTRFLPVTKTLPKTMFPVVNKPVIHHLIEEAKNASIENILIVISEEQEIIKDYFDLNSKYYNSLNKEYNELETLNNLIKNINIKFIIQDKPNGLGDAIIRCKEYIKEDAFSVILGDDLVISNESNYGIYDLINSYNKNKASYIGIKEVKLKDTYKYGIIKFKSGSNEIDYMVEKPKINPPSNFAAVGRYVFTDAIFKYLELLKENENGEILLTDAINMLIEESNVYGINFRGERFDIGDHTGYVLANIKYLINNDEAKKNVLD